MTIEEYLSELRAKLRVGPFRKRRILREIEGHLLDAVHEARIAGIGRQEAERLAIERFGSPRQLADRFDHGRNRFSRFRVAAVALAAIAVGAAAALGIVLGRNDSAPGAPVASKAVRAACGGEQADPECIKLVTAKLDRMRSSFVRATCGSSNAKAECIRRATDVARAREDFVPCSALPGMVYVGDNTWRAPRSRGTNGTVTLFDECSMSG